jgi:2-polyprenyl-3-methyl-5-hydroxy-6-metoxy-1,4-benzoquinol methylase
MSTPYQSFHAARLGQLEEELGVALAARNPADLSIVEVGPSDWAAESALFRSFGRTAVLGLDTSDPRTHGGHLSAENVGQLPSERYVVDLNADDKIEVDEPFDIVVFAETLEHLVRPAHLVLGALKGIMAEGSVMILQTPNFARISNRLKLLRGTNVQEQLRDDMHNPGHIREYTFGEIATAVEEAGLQLDNLGMFNYFTPSRVKRAIKDTLFVSAKLCDGMTARIIKP